MFSILERLNRNRSAGGSSWRFFRYAVGEILLLVVGILLALQIDGWREERDNREQEAYYLVRLADEFRYNAEEAERQAEFARSQVANAALLMESLDAELTEPEQIRWLSALNHVWFLPHPNYSDDTWSELKSTGKLELIRDRELVRAISGFMSARAHTLRLEDEWNRFNLRYRDAVNNVLDDDLRVEVLDDIDSIKGQGFARPLDRPIDIAPYVERLRRIPGIEGMIRDIWINRSVGIKLHVARQADAEAIRTMLDD